MKTVCAFLLFVSSWCSTHGCQLETCIGKEFGSCVFDDDCRKKPSLNLADKDLFGPIPAAFYALYGTTVGGDLANGKDKVALTKVELQNNQLSGSVGFILDCPTIEEVNLAGNKQLSSDQTLVGNTKLKTLNLAGTSQTSVKWLVDKVPNLESLNLANNQIKDILPITSLKKLTTLDLTGNNQITDLTPLVELTALKTITVGGSGNAATDEALYRQRDIITSGGTAATKRNQLVSASIVDIQKLAVDNNGNIQKLSDSVTGSVQTLTQKTQALEAKISALESRLSSLNQACFAAGAGAESTKAPMGQNTPPMDNAPEFGGRRLSSDCIDKAVSGATATGLISAAAAATGLMFL